LETRRDWHEDPSTPNVGRSAKVLDRTYKPALNAHVVDAIVAMQDYLGYLMRELVTGHLDAALAEADQIMSQGVHLYQVVKTTVDKSDERAADILRCNNINVRDVTP
tara:strand:+ start:3135 stop:3455 length:321 start_codon:yes stop_codon:yes gene_type:complete